MKYKNLILLVVALCAAAVSYAASLTAAWDDNSTNESGFAIERATGTSTTNLTFAEVGRVAANVTTYLDTTAAAETTYSYRIRAFNAGGFSAYSNIASGTTLPNPPTAPGNAKVAAPVAVATVTIKAGTALTVVAGN